mgnify:CR=1 FL=1
MVIENDNYKVYVLANKTNNKIYVGITKQTLDRRWKNGDGYIGCDRIYNAIQKYGWDNFTHDVFASNLTREEAMHMERLLISKFNLQDPDLGYNISEGGECPCISEEAKEKIGNALRGRTYSEEKRKLYSKAHLGKKLSSEHVQAIRDSRSKITRTEEWNENIRKAWTKYRGENHPNYGKVLTEDHLKKMHDAGKVFQREHPELWDNTRKSVQCVETGVIYPSIEIASQLLNICRSSISECASGKRKSAGGYHWKSVEKPRD